MLIVVARHRHDDIMLPGAMLAIATGSENSSAAVAAGGIHGAWSAHDQKSARTACVSGCLQLAR
jgi:hypothetical protein